MNTTRRAPTRRGGTLRALSITTAFALSGVLVAQASYSAFSASTTSAGNTWNALSLSLTNNRASAPLFAATGILPGSLGVPQYIDISMDNSVTSHLALYAANATVDSALAQALQLSITEGTLNSETQVFTPTSGGISYTGSLDDFVTKNTSFSTGLHNTDDTSYSPRTTITYQISWHLPSDAPDAAFGKSATTDLVWEARSAA